MLKDATYHKAAIQYNEELATFAEDLSKRLEHEEVARWSRAVAKQHAFHAGRHKKALKKVESGEAAEATTPESDDISKQQAEFAAEQIITEAKEA